MGAFLVPPEGATYLRDPARQTPHGEFADVPRWGPQALEILAALLSLGQGGAQAMVLPSQVIKALKRHELYRFVPNLMERQVVRPLTENASWFEKRWKNVGGPGLAKVTMTEPGAEAFPFTVEPVSRKDPVEVLKLYHNRPDVFKALALKPPGLLEPKEFGMHPSMRLGYMVQPYADEVSPMELVGLRLKMAQDAAREGWALVDMKPDNFRKWQNQIKAIDPGMFRLKPEMKNMSREQLEKIVKDAIPLSWYR